MKVVLFFLIAAAVLLAMQPVSSAYMHEKPHAQKIILKNREIRAEAAFGYYSISQYSAAKKIGGHYIVALDHMPSSEKRAELERNGMRFLEYIPENSWIVSGDREDMLELEGVEYVGPLLPEDKIAKNIRGKKVSVTFFEDADGKTQKSLMEKYGKNVSYDGSFWTAIVDDVKALAKEDAVKHIGPASLPLKALNDGSRSASWVNDAQAEYNGTNVTVAEWDNGWAEANHSGLTGRVILGDNATCSVSAGDSGTCGTTNHATHVAGIVMGNGSDSSNILYRGMAPKARLVSFEWPDSLTELFNETNNSIRLYGAVVSQNSWGYDIQQVGCTVLGDYDSWSQAYDNITLGFRLAGRLSVVFSAGNERDKAYCNQSTVQYSTISPPGQTAKNSITVGAINSDDLSMTVFSSYGPADDGRLKPEIVAAGCETAGGIRSAWSGNGYASACGTSQAAPAVSGIIALLHDAYNATHNRSLSPPASVKALLAHTAKDLNNTGPDYATGYGLVNASEALRLIKADTGTERYIAIDNVTLQGGSVEYRVNVPNNTAFLKITLAWDDWPASLLAGRQLVNDLDLVVENSTGSRFYPWMLNSSAPGAAAQRSRKDDTNNMEQMYAENPGQGVWTIRVNATTLPYAQGFTLISSHSFFDLPNVSLNYPDDNAVMTSSSMSVNCSASDSNGLKNMTLYTNRTGSWQPYASSNATGLSNSSAWIVSGLNESLYLWSCMSYDSMNNSAFAPANRSFLVDFAPRWSMNASSLPSFYAPSSISTFNVTWNDTFGISVVLLEGNFSGNASNYTMQATGNNSYALYIYLPAGALYWRSHSNDTRGNFNSTDIWAFSIQKSASNITLLLNSSDSNFTIDEDTTVNITVRMNHAAAVGVFSNGAQMAQNTTNFTENVLFSQPGTYNITAAYNESQNYTSGTASHWLIVRDRTKPDIRNYSSFPLFGAFGDSVNVSADIDDNANVSVAWLNVSNSTWSGRTFLQANGSHYTVSYNVSGLSIGEYNLSVFANDTANNTANVSIVSFSLRQMAQMNFSVYNGSSPLPAAIRLLHANTTAVKTSADNASQASFSVAAGAWDLLSISSFNVTLRGVNVTSGISGNLSIEDNLSVSSLPASVISFPKTVAVRTSLTFTSASLSIPYDDSLFISEGRIAAYACHGWTNNTCPSAWTSASWSANATANIVTVNTSNFSAFSIAESYACGDSVCDSSFGESCSSCAGDCGACPSASTGGGSGGGGGVKPVKKDIASVDMSYPRDVTAKNGTASFSLYMRNNGTVNISDISIEAGCLPLCNASYEKRISRLYVNRTAVVNFSFSFPDAGIYSAKIFVMHGNGTASVSLVLRNPCEEGSMRCFGSTLEICENASWRVSEACANGCLGTGCIEEAAEVCEPNQRYCDGMVLNECSADGKSWEKTECENGCKDGACIIELRREWLAALLPALIAVAIAMLIAASMWRRLSMKKVK